MTDWSYATPARKKRLRENRSVDRDDYEQAIETYKTMAKQEREERDSLIEGRQESILDDEQFKVTYLETLKGEIQKGLSFFHDYDRINVQIIQNINTLIETRYSGASLEEKREKATRPEKAIYEAARFLQEKLDVARFLVHPERLATAECVRFRVHGMILKYVRIYQSWFNAKNVDLKVLGESFKEIVADPRACGVIPHALVDNALKYAPSGSEVEVYIQDQDDGVLFEVSSLGPLIDKKERRKIFRPFFRGKAAADLEEGAGYGLYISQVVAREHLGTTLHVEQAETPNSIRGYYLSTAAENVALSAGENVAPRWRAG